jgi:sugar phosphate isomerase/epimerase
VKLNSAEPLDLCYCTNIHPGEGWEAVNANIRRFAPALRARFAPAEKFGIGLRLSASEARGLLRGGRLEEFRSFLNAEGLYVALINGFPYGPFHGTAVKADVYAPDWREEARVQYTLDLAEVLKELLPEGLEGGISTSPLSYKRWLKAPRNVDWETMTLNLARVAEALVQIRRDTGQFIHLDIEPEPDCLIENSGELIWFFEGWLLPAGGSYLAKKLGVAKSEARRHLLDHIQTCFDCCHFAVEYEDPADALARIARTGIKVGRVQLSSALEVMLPDDPAQRARVGARLAPFAESTYLHQVIEKRGDCLHHFSDLGEALSEAAEHGASQWRIHFHVPLFTREYDGFCSTQSYVRKVLEIAISTPFTRRLEIETYTWDVLPSELKLDLLDSIGREYEWVLSQIGAARGAAG